MIWLLLACQAEEEGTLKKPEAVEEISDEEVEGPYLLESEQEEITVDFAALEQDLNSLLSQLFSFHPQNIIDSYEGILAGASDDCPQWYVNEEGVSYWYDYCYTEDGHAFEGYGTALMMLNTQSEDGTIWSGTNVWGAGSIQSPDGTTIKMNGWISTRTGTHDNGTTNNYAGVTAGYSLSSSESSWEQETPYSEVQATHNTIGHRYIYINGLYPTENITVMLEGLQMLYLGEDECNIEPIGNISIFLDDVGWLDLSLEGVEDLWAPAEAGCDGCGSLFRKGVFLSEICLDFSSLISWNEEPWESLE